MKTTLEVKVDERKRIVLSKFAQPGQVYRVEAPEPGQIVLRLMIPVEEKPKMTYAKALEAIRNSGLKFSGSS